MKLEPLTLDDLEGLKNLQPPDWTDITIDIRYYIERSFCYPLKATVNGEIAGTATAVIFGDTAWLAHIIVHPQYRNQGIGFAMVNELLAITRQMKVSSCVLTATELGKPVYAKAGFKSISAYKTFGRDEKTGSYQQSDCIFPFHEKYRDEIYRIDQHITGENRKALLDDFIQEAKVFVLQNRVRGFYLPTLKEGPVLAVSNIAGEELLKIKCAESTRVVVTAENRTAIRFLTEHDYKPMENHAVRMVLGKDVDWKPEMIFSRAGGNYG